MEMRKIDHVGIIVNDLSATTAFFRDVWHTLRFDYAKGLCTKTTTCIHIFTLL